MWNNLNLDLRNTAAQQLAIAILDTSSSMRGDPIEQVRRGACRFKEQCASQPRLRNQLRVQFVTFGGTIRLYPFMPITSVEIPPLSADGDTPLAEALLQAIAATDEQSSALRHVAELEVYKPRYFLFSDGAPTSSYESLQAAAAKVRKYEQLRCGEFYAFGVNENAAQAMQSLFVRRVEVLSDANFAAFFDIISASVYQVSSRIVGEDLDLNPIIRGFLKGPSNDRAE